MSEHVCQCRSCMPPDYYPDGPKQGEHHIAIRFGDRWWDVYLNGELIKGVNEALAGKDGYVVAYSIAHLPGYSQPSKHVCQLCQAKVPVDSGGYVLGDDSPELNACEYVTRGRVEMLPTEPWR